MSEETMKMAVELNGVTSDEDIKEVLGALVQRLGKLTVQALKEMPSPTDRNRAARHADYRRLEALREELSEALQTFCGC